MAPEGPSSAEQPTTAPFVKDDTDPEIEIQAGGGITTDSGDSDGEDSAAHPGPQRLATSNAPNPVLLGSLVLLGIGLAMFGLRFAARRVR